MNRGRWGLPFVCAAVAAASYGLLEQWVGPETTSHERVLWSTLYSQWVWVLVAIGAATMMPGSVSFRLGIRRGEMGVTALALATAGTLCLSNATSLLLIDLGVRDTGTLARIDQIVDQARGAAPWLALLALGMAPGVGEELLFRGLVQRTLATRMRSASAVAIAAALFGLIHMDPVHSPSAFALGLYLGTIGAIAGNVWAPMFCHAANNSVGIAAGLSALAVPGASAVTSAAIWVGVSLALLGAAIWRSGPDSIPSPGGDAGS